MVTWAGADYRVVAGWEALIVTAISMLHITGQEVMQIYNTAVHHPPGREVSFRSLSIMHTDRTWRAYEMIRLNSRAGVFALSLATWHGMRIVSLLVP